MFKPLDKFIIGEGIDLCVPTEEFALKSNWYKWFNNKQTTRYLEQGLYENTPEKQLEFLKMAKDRLILIIFDKKNYVGVVNLSMMNFDKRTCDIAVVTGGDKLNIAQSMFNALEAMSLIMDHGFTKLGFKKITAGLHVELSSWQQRLELIGFKLEGYYKDGFIKGNEMADSISISCLYEDYQELCNKRGRLWDSKEKMLKRILQLPKVKMVDKLKKFNEEERDVYYERVFEL